MSFLNINYEMDSGEHGLARITATGRCTEDEAAGIEANCTRRYSLHPLPNMAGAILKSLDGSLPRVLEVSPGVQSTRKYSCVKVEGRVNPFAPVQDGGDHEGKAVVSFSIVYQEVSSTS